MTSLTLADANGRRARACAVRADPVVGDRGSPVGCDRAGDGEAWPRSPSRSWPGTTAQWSSPEPSIYSSKISPVFTNASGAAVGSWPCCCDIHAGQRHLRDTRTNGSPFWSPYPARTTCMRRKVSGAIAELARACHAIFVHRGRTGLAS
jgi:hypothetical protein